MRERHDLSRLRGADATPVMVSHGGGGAETGRDLVVLGPRMAACRAGDGRLAVGRCFGGVRARVIHRCAVLFVLCVLARQFSFGPPKTGGVRRDRRGRSSPRGRGRRRWLPWRRPPRRG